MNSNTMTHMKKSLLMAAMLLLTAATAMAVPAKPGPRQYTQPDGSRLTIFVHGDETYHYTTDAEGNLLTLTEDGWYVNSGAQPTGAGIAARRAAGRIQRPNRPRRVGSVNLAPR